MTLPTYPNQKWCDICEDADHQTEECPRPCEAGECNHTHTEEEDANDAPYIMCEWYAMCANRATIAVPHRVIGLVLTCDRCAAKHDLTGAPIEEVTR